MWTPGLEFLSCGWYFGVCGEWLWLADLSEVQKAEAGEKYPYLLQQISDLSPNTGKNGVLGIFAKISG